MQTNESELELKKWYQEYRKQVLNLDRFPEQSIVKVSKKKPLKKKYDKNRNKN
jgi:hypothetical protein